MMNKKEKEEFDNLKKKAEVEEAIERCQSNEDYDSDHPIRWAQFRISDVKTLIQAARQPQKDVSVLVEALRGVLSIEGVWHYDENVRLKNRLDAIQKIVRKALKDSGEVV